MGQYHVIANLDKWEFIHAHAFGDGLKAGEQVGSGPGGTASALLALIVSPLRRGGGDLPDDPFMGRWHGDHVVFVGDYAEADDFPSFTREGQEITAANLYGLCHTVRDSKEDPGDPITQQREYVAELEERDEEPYWLDGARRLLELLETVGPLTDVSEGIRNLIARDFQGYLAYVQTEWGGIDRVFAENGENTVRLQPDVVVVAGVVDSS